MERRYKLEGQSGRRRGIAGVPGELSERTAQQGVWWMSPRWESAEDIEALWPLLLLGCCLLFIDDSALPVPHAVISCSITKLHDNWGACWIKGLWRFWLQPYYRLAPFIPLQTDSILLIPYIYIIWTASSPDNCGSLRYFSESLKKQIKTVLICL